MGTVVATTKMIDLEVEFEKQLVERANRVRATKPHYEPPPRTVHISTHHRHHCHDNSGDDESQSGMSVFRLVNCLCFIVVAMAVVELTILLYRAYNSAVQSLHY